jgi:glutamate 5-kinase
VAGGDAAKDPRSLFQRLAGWPNDRTKNYNSEDGGSAMRAKLTVAAVCTGLLLAAVPMMAHHSFAAEYDATKAVKMTGTVTQMEWINPHAWIHMDVKKPDGKVESWMVEAGAPNALLRRGFNKQSLLPGTVITVEGYQAKDGAMRANGRDITYQDGRKLFVGSSGTGAPDERKE